MRRVWRAFVIHTGLPRLAVDGKQIIHPRNYLHRIKIVLIHFDGVDKFSARMGQAAGMDHGLRADAVVISRVAVGLQNAGVAFQKSSLALAIASHAKVKDHAPSGRSVLPEIHRVMGTLFLRRLHSDRSFVGLDVTAGEDLILHGLSNRNEDLADAQNRVVDGRQRQIESGIA